MFSHLGLALRIVREWRGASVGDLAEKAGIGKSQLSKYENGRELPKLDSLEKVLGALNIGPANFFLVLDVIERQLERHGASDAHDRASTDDAPGDAITRAFQKTMDDLVDLHRIIVEDGVRQVLYRKYRKE